MKKTFQLTAPNKKPERQVEAIKFEIKKYLARERRKTVPDGADFWNFDCRIGASEAKASVILVSEIRQKIDQLVAEENKDFYLEILAKPGHKPIKDGSDETGS